MYSLILTNTTTGNISVDVFINDGTSRLIKGVTVPSGAGKTKSVTEVVGAWSAGDKISLQAGSTTSFNYFLTGRLV